MLAEPDPHMAKRLRERLLTDTSAAGSPSVIEAPAEDLPFDDGSFDTVVATLVLCTVEDPLARAGRDAARPGRGRLAALPRARAQSAHRRAWWQDRLERPWGFFAGGCHPNRATDELLAGAGFWIDQPGASPKLPKARRSCGR